MVVERGGHEVSLGAVHWCRACSSSTGWERETAMVESVIDKLAIARLGPHRFVIRVITRGVVPARLEKARSQKHTTWKRELQKAAHH